MMVLRLLLLLFAAAVYPFDSAAAQQRVTPPAQEKPAIGAVGDTVTITGTNFGNDKRNGAVIFNGTRADIINWKSVIIEVRFPQHTTTGDIVVISQGPRHRLIEFYPEGVDHVSQRNAAGEPVIHMAQSWFLCDVVYHRLPNRSFSHGTSGRIALHPASTGLASCNLGVDGHEPESRLNLRISANLLTEPVFGAVLPFLRTQCVKLHCSQPVVSKPSNDFHHPNSQRD